MIQYWCKGLIVFILSAITAVAESGTRTDTNRAAMLYDNHRIQCHTQQVHWRDKKMVADWKSLVEPSGSLAHSSGLQWSESDIKEVSQYLNGKYYQYP
jgi:hypothetical protein